MAGSHAQACTFTHLSLSYCVQFVFRSENHMVTTENNLKTETPAALALHCICLHLGVSPPIFIHICTLFRVVTKIYPQCILFLFSSCNCPSAHMVIHLVTPQSYGIQLLLAYELLLFFPPSLSCFLGVPSQKQAFREWTCEHLRGLFKFCCFSMSLALESLVAMEICTAVLLLLSPALPTHGGCGPHRRLLGSCLFTLEGKVRVVQAVLAHTIQKLGQ